MTLAARFDGIQIEQLREVGGMKWSAFPDKIGAFVAEMDFGTAPSITEALHAAVDRGVFGYLPPALSREMSRAYSQWSSDVYDWTIPAENIRPLPDVLAGMAATIDHFSAPGGAVIVPTPAYMPFLSIPEAMGREVIEVPMLDEGGHYSYDLAALDAAFKAGGNLLVLCNPHNPIGRVLSRSEMEAIAKVVDANDGRVFSDEIHAPLVFSTHRHLPYAAINDVAANHTITAASASKAWNLPGMKCAQLILSNEADKEKWDNVGMMAEHGAANLGVIASTAAYTAGGKWLNEIIEYLEGNRDLLADLVAEHLPGVRYLPPEGTYLAWLDCRDLGLEGLPGDFFANEAGVALVDGSRCGEVAHGFVRYNFATPRPIMIETIKAMGVALKQR